MMSLLRGTLPAISDEVAQRQETRDPYESPPIGEYRKFVKRQFRGAGHHGREVPHAWDVIANSQCPSSRALEPVMHPMQLLIGDMEQPPVSVHERQAERPSQPVAHRDTASAPQKR